MWGQIMIEHKRVRDVVVDTPTKKLRWNPKVMEVDGSHDFPFQLGDV